MRAPLYASSEFPNANPDLHAGRIDPALWPDVDDAFGDGEVDVVEELPALAASEAEIEVVGEERETPRESMIRLVSALSVHADHDDLEEDEDERESFDLEAFSSLTLPTLPPLDPALLASLEESEESDIDREPMLAPVVLASVIEMFAPIIADEIGAPAPSPVAEDEPVRMLAEQVEQVQQVQQAEPCEPVDAFSRLIETICEVASSAGVSVSAMAMVELLSGRPVPPVLLGAASGTLVAGGIADDSEGSALVAGSKIKLAAAEWARIVRDEGGDLEACGGKTLDEFSADIACAIVGDRSKFDALRRALRGRGIAAYGFVCDAA